MRHPRSRPCCSATSGSGWSTSRRAGREGHRGSPRQGGRSSGPRAGGPGARRGGAVRTGGGTRRGMKEATTVTRRIALAPDVDLLPLLGRNDDHLRTLEAELAVQIVARGHEIVVKGDGGQVAKAERMLVQLAELVRAGTAVHGAEVRAALRILADDDQADLKSIFSDAIVIPGRKKLIAPKSVNQRRYLESVRKNDLVFAIGPAGTGKSYLGVAMAVSALLRRSVTGIVLTRLGFNSKMVVTGDITQVDLPSSKSSGLIEIQSILKGVPGIGFVYFDERDVVRHRLVSAIVRAYEIYEAGGRGAAGGGPSNRGTPRAASGGEASDPSGRAPDAES